MKPLAFQMILRQRPDAVSWPFGFLIMVLLAGKSFINLSGYFI